MTKRNANYIFLKKNQNTEQYDLNIGGGGGVRETRKKNVSVYKLRKTKTTREGKEIRSYL